MNDERYWNINLLNKWFAISSIIFMVSMIWMFIDDNDDDFKVYQRKFRQMEIENEEEKLIAELELVKEERVIFEEKLSSAQTSFEAKNSQLLEAEKSLEGSEAKFYKANMNFLSKKSILDVEKFNYETAMLHLHEGDDPTKIEDKYQSVVDAVFKLKIIKEEKEAAMLANETQIKEIKLETEIAQDELNSVLKAVNLVDRKLKLIDRQKMSIANKIGDIVRDLPILDFMAPYFKVEQVVLPDIKYNVNFASVPEVDRCKSCHLGIDNPDYKDAEQPFTSHPNLDLYLTSSSPHAYENFGCTTCHAGRGRGTDFTSATHTPSSPEQRAEWEEKYDWHEMHHWLKPMLPTKYSEASCFKCHQDEANIAHADKLTMGLTLIEKNGCNGCHTIKSLESRRKSGPDLARINEKVNKDWVAKWIKDPKGFRHDTRMPSFFNQSNNSDIDSKLRNDTEIYAMTEYLFQDGEKMSRKNDRKFMGNAEKGQELFDVVGCRGCHIIENNPNNMTEDIQLADLLKEHGPNLINLGSKTSAQWLYNWLRDPSEYWHDTRMPNLRLSDEEAENLTAYLMNSTNTEFDTFEPIQMSEEALDEIALGWLRKMYPEKEANSRLADMVFDNKIDYVADKSIRYYGCFGCHNIPGYEDAKPIGTELTFEGSKPLNKLDFGYVHDIEHTNYAWFTQKLENPRRFDKGKSSSPEDKLRMPNFEFSPIEIEALVTTILGFTEDEVGENLIASNYVNDETVYEGRKLIKEYNCQGCHIIDGFGGQIAEYYSAPEYAPPNLNTQGAKVHPDWLFDFFKDPMIIRPNLQVRMPSFNMTDEEWNAIIKAFQHRDNNLLAFESDFHVDKSTTKFKAGKKLHELGACNNCHFYGTEFPKQAAQTWAPNLALTKERLHPDWVIEWMRDPQGIMPGTKMPAPYLPDKEILNLPGAESDWGKYVVQIGGDQEVMLEGLRDYIYSIKGETDITKEIQAYFKKNGYEFESEEEDEDEDW
ncbi:MAG TPA: c-type cytochrome [Candidatus Marinimicrobia bacterium]|nr:c-type cytochrome [Candidatus Neomarinimicrobiota bacterium]